MKMTPANLRDTIWQRESWLLFLEGGNADLYQKLTSKSLEHAKYF